jgi:hypothetical protein
MQEVAQLRLHAIEEYSLVVARPCYSVLLNRNLFRFLNAVIIYGSTFIMLATEETYTLSADNIALLPHLSLIIS